MRALLLAAGIGSRLRPLTNSLPKCLVPIGGRPLIDYWLDSLFKGGIERVLINTHHLADQVRSHIASSPWRDQVDLVHEDKLLGTGGTVLASRNFFKGAAFLVAHADNFTTVSIGELIRLHAGRPLDCLVTMLAFRTDDPSSCGILALDSKGVVRAFYEKVVDPPGNLANAAVYVMEPEIMEIIAALGKPVIDLSTEIIPRLIGRVFAVETAGYHCDIGTPGRLAQTQASFPEKIPRETYTRTLSS